MDKGSRMLGLFQTLEKYQGQSKFSNDDYLQIKHATSKIHHYVSSQDKTYRDMLLKNSNNLDLVLSVLDCCPDPGIRLTIITTLHEVLSKSGGRPTSTLVSHGATNVLFRVLVSQQRLHEATEESQHLIHQVLAKLGPKDKKFGMKARLSQSVAVTLDLAKTHCNNQKTIHSLLLVLKLYSANAVNASYLGKNGLIPLLLKIIQTTSRRNTSVIKTCLDTLILLVKRKSNASRAVTQGGVPELVKLFYEWHRLDSNSNNNIPLRKSIIGVLKHLTNIKSGKKAFLEADGMRTLYVCSLDCGPQAESLCLQASFIMRKCFPRNKLPLTSLASPTSFPLPGPYTTQSSSQSHLPSISSDGLQERETTNLSTSPVPLGDQDSSSVDTDDDLSDDNCADKLNSEDEDDVYIAQSTVNRTWEDISMYRKFFPELHDFQVSHNGSSRNAGNTSKFPDVFGDSEQPQPQQGAWNPFRTKAHQGPCAGVCADILSSTIQSLTIALGGDKSQVSDLLEANSVASRKPLVARSSTNRLAATSSKSQSKRDSNTGTDTVRNQSNNCQGSQEERKLGRYVSPYMYTALARKTTSVGRFNKIAYPDMFGSLPPPNDEPLQEKKFGVHRQKIFEDIERHINPDTLIDRVVYDLDAIIAASESYTHQYSTLGNDDRKRVGEAEADEHLQFNSQFESGNLRKAIQVRDHEYDLLLSPDVNTNHHHQWFYFQVHNTQAKVKYRFNIVNCEKINSQFNFGMQPVLFSVKDAMEGRPYWRRAGSEIAYYRNHYSRSCQVTGGVKGKYYYTMTFALTFKHDKDVCYLAYHYPYTYTTLQAHLYNWERSHDKDEIYLRQQTLCETVSGNSVPLLTITSYTQQDSRSKPYVFLTSRVHPGESNASWVMHGTLDFLLGDTQAARALREAYIFKVVPMLNPDGVINGNHRCSLSGEDLNRCWMGPCAKTQPTIYHCKGLLQYMAATNKPPVVFCDYHGHSRKKNVFLYGCDPRDSWIPDDQDNPACMENRTVDISYKTLPEILHHVAPSFSIENCSFTVEKSKETTARVVVWRQIGILRSYTMESTYCGCDQGPYRGLQISTSQLEEMGIKFCEGLLRLSSRMLCGSNSSSSSSSIASDHLPPAWLGETRSAGAGTPIPQEVSSDQDDDIFDVAMQQDGEAKDDES